jgi:hypothetical protein
MKLSMLSALVTLERTGNPGAERYGASMNLSLAAAERFRVKSPSFVIQ